MQQESGSRNPPTFSASKPSEALSPTAKHVAHQLSQKQLPGSAFSPMKQRPAPIITIENAKEKALAASSSQVIVGQRDKSQPPVSPTKTVKPTPTSNFNKQATQKGTAAKRTQSTQAKKTDLSGFSLQPYHEQIMAAAGY